MFGGVGRLISALGSHEVDVYEWEQADIRKARLSNGPKWADLASAQPKLHFNGWQLAHAVVKADYLVQRDLLIPGLGFLLQIDLILDFAPGSNLRILPGSSASLNDFTRTSISGRIGQGLSLLFAQSKGYNFAGHLASDPAVSKHLKSLRKPAKAADFLFETQGLQRMILESKGSFSQPDDNPSRIKTVLKAALTGQVDYWMNKITPTASKGFVVYSCLRETGNPTPSALIFVDPPGSGDLEPVELPKSWVRRSNYAAWLTLMGLIDTATSLRGLQRRDRTAYTLPIFQLGDRSFAVSPFYAPHKEGKWVGVGLDVQALEAIGMALTSDEQPLLTYDGDFADSGSPTTRTGQNWSVFPDGSWFGEMDGKMPFVGVGTFQL